MFPRFECPHHFHPIPSPSPVVAASKLHRSWRFDVASRAARCRWPWRYCDATTRIRTPPARCSRSSGSASGAASAPSGITSCTRERWGWGWGEHGVMKTWEYLGFLMIHMILRPWKLGDRRKLTVKYNYIYISSVFNYNWNCAQKVRWG